MYKYITTPIYYVNSSPHIGHAYTSIIADILKNNYNAIGYQVFLSTGLDEHGQKNQDAAKNMNLKIKKKKLKKFIYKFLFKFQI